jgi:hypothetical protein
VQLSKTKDDTGSEITVTSAKREANGNDPFAALLRDAMPEIMVGGKSILGRGVQQLTLNLEGTSAPARRIPELAGTLTALLQGAPQAVLELDDVAAAVGKTHQAKNGTELRVVKAERRDNGEVDLQVDVLGGDGGGPLGGAQMQVQILGNNGQFQPFLGNLTPFTLYDNDGQKYVERSTSSSSRRGGGKPQTSYRLTLVPAQPQSQPKRLTYVAPLSARIEVPFTLRDVPLR